MRKSERQIVSRIIGAGIFCSMLLSYPMIAGALRSFPMSMLRLAQYALQLAVSIGLIKFRRWGFIAMYASFLVMLLGSVYGISTSYVPPVLRIPPLGHFVLNTLITGILVVIHVAEEKRTRFAGTDSNKAPGATSESMPIPAVSAHQVTTGELRRLMLKRFIFWEIILVGIPGGLAGLLLLAFGLHSFVPIIGIGMLSLLYCLPVRLLCPSGFADDFGGAYPANAWGWWALFIAYTALSIALAWLTTRKRRTRP